MLSSPFRSLIEVQEHPSRMGRDALASIRVLRTARSAMQFDRAAYESKARFRFGNHAQDGSIVPRKSKNESGLNAGHMVLIHSRTAPGAR